MSSARGCDTGTQASAPALIGVWIDAQRHDPAVTLAAQPPAGGNRVRIHDPKKNDIARRCGFQPELRNDTGPQACLAQLGGERRRHLLQAVADQDEAGAPWLIPFSRAGSNWTASLIAIANPTPTFPSTGLSMESLMPITWPCALSRGPPESPGLMDASVWIRWDRLAPPDTANFADFNNMAVIFQ